MVWSGGTYKKGNFTTNGWTGDASLGIGIEAGRHDTQDDDFATGINQCLNKDGSNAATGNLNAGAFRVTNIGAGTARTDAAQVGQVQDGTSSYLGTTGGTSTAFTVAATPTITALVTGAQYRFKANAANGVAATLKIDGTTATTMQRQGTALAGNEFKANDFVSVVYDGTNFQITNVATAPLYVDRTNNRVGIGTTTPAFEFEVHGNTTRNVNVRYSNDVVGSYVFLQKSRSATVGTNTIVQSGDVLGGVFFQGANGTGYTTAAAIYASVDGTPGASNDMPGALIFQTTPDGSGTQLERMRITGAGNVGIGVTPAASNRFAVQGTTADSTATCLALQNSTPASVFYIRNDGFINSGTLAGSPYNNILGVGANMYVGSDGTFYRATSSIKYKTDVEDYDKGLAELLTLRSVYYKDKTNPSAQYAGLIAEEVLEAGMPEFIQYAADNTPDGLSYGHMMSLAVNSIKELNVKVEALEARIAALEA